MKQRLTQAMVDGIAADATRDTYISDDGLTGLRLRVTQAGKRILYFQYRSPDGRQRKLSFGSNVDAARRAAKNAAAKLAKGEDPQADADRLAVMPTMRAVSERYLTDHVRENLKPATIELYEGIFRQLPDKLMAKRIAEVTPADIGAVMREMKDRKQRANTFHAVLRAFFEWCASPMIALLDGKNPTDGVPRYPAVRRSFVFEGDQLYRFREALDALEATMWPPAIGALRLLLFTGMRRDEALLLTWAEVDLDARRINLADSKTGARMVPLGREALAVLQAAKAQAEMLKSNYVFPSPRDRSKPIRGIKKIWKKVIEKAGMPGLRIHDLRHNFGGMAAASTGSAVHVKSLLGHTQITTTDRYMKLAEHPLTEAADATNDAIVKAMQPKNVVSLKRPS